MVGYSSVVMGWYQVKGDFVFVDGAWDAVIDTWSHSVALLNKSTSHKTRLQSVCWTK
jgi:hypothetical protein